MNPPEKIILVSATLEFPLCPTVFSGRTADGATVTARYRWGRLSVRLDDRDPPILGGAAGRWIVERQIDPNGLDGCMSYEDLQKLTADWIEWPAELSPPKYEGDMIDL
jgi:hypothetical protein